METAWRRHADKLSRRILSESEIDYSRGFSPNRLVEFLSGRFAAKEAIAKAVGCGLAKLQMPCVTVALGTAGLMITWEPPTNVRAQSSTVSSIGLGGAGGQSGPGGPGGPRAADAGSIDAHSGFGAIAIPPWPADAMWHVSITHAAGIAVAMAILEQV